MIYQDCLNNESNEDCGKCSKYGYIFGCEENCPEYINFFGYDIKGNKKEGGMNHPFFNLMLIF